MFHLTLSEDEFAKKIFEVVKPSTPIDRHELLMGRDDYLREIRRALYAPGKHIFIFGDRGIGKSSLAHTAAVEFQSTDFDPIFIVCGPTDTFSSVIRSVLKRSPKGVLESKSQRRTTEVDAKFFKHQIESTEGSEAVPIQLTIEQALSLIDFAFKDESERLVVVIDEIDVISNQKERQLIASFIKGLGDRSTLIKFIFTGVATSLDDIIGEHESAIRQLRTIHLQRLMFQPLMDIVTNVFEHFKLLISREILFRMAAISDGYPHYVHTMCEAILWQVFDSQWEKDKIDEEVFYPSLNRAIELVSYQIRKPYEDATESRSENVKFLVWAAADSYDLERRIGHIKLSYKSLIHALNARDQLSEKVISAKLNDLKKPSHGSILSGVRNRRGMYKFSENMVRGYVRLQAESQGIELTHDGDAPDLLVKKQPHVSPRHKYHNLSKYVPNIEFRKKK